MNWRQQVKIFADKNIKGSDRSETSGTISYSVVEPTYSANTPPGFSENIILLFGVLQQVFVVFDIFLTFDY